MSKTNGPTLRKGSPVRARINGILAAAIVMGVNKKECEVSLKVGSKNHTVPYDLSRFHNITKAEYDELATTQDLERIEKGKESKVVRSQRIFIAELKKAKGDAKSEGFRASTIERYRKELKLSEKGADTYFYNANLALVRQENLEAAA